MTVEELAKRVRQLREGARHEVPLVMSGCR